MAKKEEGSLLSSVRSEGSTSAHTIRESDQQIRKLKGQVEVLREQNTLLEKEVSLLERRQRFLDTIGPDPSTRAHVFRPKKPSSSATAILGLCDWHTEEKVDPETVNGVNAHHLGISAARSKAVVEKFLMLLESSRRISNIREIVIATLGDFITGYIHEELQESNSLSPTEASLFVFDQLHILIKTVLAEAKVDQILIPTAIGNHGRTTRKMRHATAYKNSYEWLIYQQLARAFQNEPRVKWKISKSYLNYMDVQGHSIRFHHGDNLSYNGGVGGITIPVLKAIGQWNKTKHAHLDVFGHWHQFMYHRQFVSCNCLIGHSPYAVAIKAEYAPPSQTYIVIDRDRQSPVEVREIYAEDASVDHYEAYRKPIPSYSHAA